MNNVVWGINVDVKDDAINNSSMSAAELWGIWKIARERREGRGVTCCMRKSTCVSSRDYGEV